MTMAELYQALGVSGYKYEACWRKDGVFHLRMRAPASSYRKPPTNPFLPRSVVRRPVSSDFSIPRGVCLMVRLELLWHQRISWLQSSGLTVAAGSSSKPAKDGRFVDSGDGGSADDSASCCCSTRERRTILRIGSCIATRLG